MKKNIFSGFSSRISLSVSGLFALTLSLSAVSCSDFEDLNKDPFAAGADQTQIEYFINNSIIGAQQDPDVAERAFVLYWKDAAHFDRIGSLSEGYTSDEWTTAYYNQSSTWQTNINSAIELYNSKKASGVKLSDYEENLYQVSRIWRAYLMSEFTDIFGAMPIKAFQGTNPDFNSVKDVYDFLLKELTEASGALKPSATSPNKDLDPAYGYDFKKWKRFAGSLRMRLAMRLLNANPDKAKDEFQKAVATGEYIMDYGDIFSVQEMDGWNALTGVMTRAWNDHVLSATINNLSLGLGGLTSEELLKPFASDFKAAIEQRKADQAAQIEANSKVEEKDKKPVWPDLTIRYLAKDEMGVYYPQHFATKSNDPAAGYFANGLPFSIDPRMYKLFSIPGNTPNAHFWVHPWNVPYTNTPVRGLMSTEKGKETETYKELDAAFTWNAYVAGNWKTKGTINKVQSWLGTQPRLVKEFRNSSMKRVFFGNWETYFLIAEAAEYGWTVPMTGKEAYEKGVRASFEYWDKALPDSYSVAGYVDRYLADKSFSRVGTSVAWGHTAEPPAAVKMTRVNGYTGKAETFDYKYPINNLYKNGTVHNDHLTKIITQKYLAQLPWLPLEAWSDQRRLGLPFFENPAVEDKIETLPALTDANYTESRWEFFPQRIKYPSSLANNVPDGYKQAVGLLNGPDELATPLYWSKAAKK